MIENNFFKYFFLNATSKMLFDFARTVICLIIYFKKLVIANDYIQSCLSIDQLKYGEDAFLTNIFNKNLSLIRVIKSLNYPNQYPKDIHCIFLIYGKIKFETKNVNLTYLDTKLFKILLIINLQIIIFFIFILI